MSIVKKLIVGFVAFALCLSLGGVVVNASEADEIRSEMDEIDATLQMILDLLGGDDVVPTDDNGEEEETTPVVGIPDTFSFTRDLRVGSTGPDVKYLQILLNADVDTRLAATGAGSPGNETEHFGPITDAAVKKFQTKYSAEVLAPVNLTTATGYVGVQTRNKLNAMLADGVVTAPVKDDQMEEILKLLTQVIADVAALQTKVDEMAERKGDEGDFDVTRLNTIRSVELYPNQTKDVAAYRLEAEDSDITVQRIDVYAMDSADVDYVTANFDMTNFRRDIDAMALYHDGEKVGEAVINSSTVDRKDGYVRFTGLNIDVDKDGYEDVVVQVTTADVDTFNSTNDYYTVGLHVRGLDGANLNVYSFADEVRRFDVDDSDTVELLADDYDSPEEGVVLLDDEDETEVVLLQFEVTADGGKLELDEFEVDVTAINRAGGAINLGLLVNEYVLYQGTQTIAVEDAVAAGNTQRVVFDDIDIDLDAGDSLVFYVAALVKEADDTAMAYTSLGSSLTATLVGGNNGSHAYSEADHDYTDVKESVEGEPQHLYLSAPLFADISGDIERNDNEDNANGYLEFNMTPLNGDITVTGINFVDPANFDWNTVIEVDGSGLPETVDKDDKVEIDITGATVQTGGGGSDWVRIEVEQFDWTCVESGETFNWVLDFVKDLRTGRVFISH